MIDWNNIDTVMLDMDGTLLDLHFDNYFWLEHLPKRYAEIHQVDFATATQRLHDHINEHEGTLQWYCLEFWSDALKVDIRSLKTEIKHKIQIRPHVKEFLTRLRQQRKKCLLVTNAHPQSLSLKIEVTAIDQYLDIIISSHEFKYPKEDQAFWHALQEREQFDPQRTLFVDDTVRVLKSAEQFGIKYLLGIHQPDSKKQRLMDEFPAIHHFDEIMPPAL